MTKTTRIVLIAALLVIVAGIQSAHATAKLKLSDGNPLNDLIIVDGDGNDFEADVGIVGYEGAFGSFSINITSGVTYPAIGDTSYPQMDLASLFTFGIGWLEISFTEIGFGPLGVPSIQTRVGGTTQGVVEFASYYRQLERRIRYGYIDRKPGAL